jgi:hypothetical protein
MSCTHDGGARSNPNLRFTFMIAQKMRTVEIIFGVVSPGATILSTSAIDQHNGKDYHAGAW